MSMRALNYTLIKLSFCLIVGILIGFYIPISLKTALTLTVFLLATLFILLLIARKQFNKTPWFGLFTYLTMIVVGILCVTLHNQKLKHTHYSRIATNSTDSLSLITFKIREILKPNAYNKKYVVDLLELNNETVTGRLLLNLSQDSLAPHIKVDNVFIYKTKLFPIPEPLNPYAFNYKSYLERQYIYHQIFAKHTLLLPVPQSKSTLFGLADNIRQHINNKLKRYNFKPKELAVINALLLGQRQDIDKATYTNYVNAGAIHILAISGLHVGIILLFLNMLFKPLEHLRHGALIKTILLVAILWCFAFIAGLSPSVTRAVTMFSMLAITINLKRPTNTYNTLTLSLFLLLLVKSMFLFDVGFQLSYLAVFSIVSVDPLLYRLWQPKFWIVDKLWHTFTVTLAAQLGILPLSLFYFHQFPGLFFISNLVIIPLLGFILGLGVLVFILAATNLLPTVLANLFAFFISILNGFVEWVASHEDYLIKNIAINFWQVIAFYFLIICCISFLKKPIYSRLKLFLIAIIVLQSSFIYTMCNKPKNTFIVFHKNRFSLLGHVTNNKIIVNNDFDSITKISDNTIRNYCIGTHIKTIETDSIKSIYTLNSKNVLVVDSFGIYTIKSFKPNHVLLRQSPKINLNRLIDSLRPKQIIADGSNYKSYVTFWKQLCKKRKLPFHDTSEKGAFILRY